MDLFGWRSDLPDVYSDFDLTLLTSRSEGTPLALLETMACRKPFVAPPVGGIPDLVAGPASEDGGARYFQNAALTSREPRAMSLAILRLLLDQSLRERMGQNALQFVLTRFSAERLARDTAALYLKLLGAHAPKTANLHPLPVREQAVTEPR